MKSVKKPTSGESKAHPKDGKRLRNIRKHKGKTQIEFAQELGISTGTFANYENAKTEMSPSIWRSIYYYTGANPVPLDPEEDPYDVITQLKAKASGVMASVELTQHFLISNMNTRIAYGNETQNRLAHELRKSPNLTATLNQFTQEISQIPWRSAISITSALPDIVDQHPPHIAILEQGYTNASQLSVIAQKQAQDTATQGSTQLTARIALKSTIDYIRQMRRKSLHLRNNVYTPFRRRVTDACNHIHLLATLVFANEHIRRAYFDGGAETSNYRDLIYVVSFLLIGIFMISAIRSIPWGVKIEEPYDIQT